MPCSLSGARRTIGSNWSCSRKIPVVMPSVAYASTSFTWRRVTPAERARDSSNIGRTTLTGFSQSSRIDTMPPSLCRIACACRLRERSTPGSGPMKRAWIGVPPPGPKFGRITVQLASGKRFSSCSVMGGIIPSISR